MNDTTSESAGTSGRNIAVSAVIGALVAGVILVIVVLPAEYGVDPTGIGGKLGLTQMNAEPSRIVEVEVVDVLSGNEQLASVEIPDFGEPVPLPNTSIHQLSDTLPRIDTLELTIDAESETEVKTVLGQSQVIVYTWATDQGKIYADFHGHDPALGNEFWVRYREDQEGSSGHSGSLVAPFSGEHGWYWLNYNEFPVTVTLTVTGFHDDIIDYSELF
ncbi:MAG: hypothetical protein PVF63_06395 [Gammaproteobacteria bacterium]|jgi:hypothetical protein